MIDEYRSGLSAAGLEHIQIVDSGADLNAYAKVENQSGCCSPSMETGSPFQLMEESCCSPAINPMPSLHEELATLLSQYDINAAVASVKVYAIKPTTIGRSGTPKGCQWRRFPSHQDTRDVGAWELVANALALKAGIQVPDAKALRFAESAFTSFS